MKEQIVVSMTSWRKRLCNVPKVIDSILAQTRKPDVVVLNLAEQEFPNKEIPAELVDYINNNAKLKLNWVNADTRVWKKFLPILEEYPEALIVPIDDDIIYPKTMIADFMRVHRKYPDDPISGNKFSFGGVKCHCGCASMVQAKHFEGWRRFYKHRFRVACLSSDIFYTRLAAANGYFYRETDVDYQKTAVTYNEVEGYSASLPKGKLAISDNVVYEALHYSVQKIEDGNKPWCVLCSAQNEAGKEIEKNMLEWLQPIYNVYLVRHDCTLYEYPGLRMLQLLTERTGKPMLYLHTRGAFHRWKTTSATHRLWRHEFGEEREKYFSLVNTPEATAACPFSGQSKYTLYNGFVVNPAAMAAIPVIEQNENRFIYEKIFEGSNVNVIGTIVNYPDDEETKQAARKFLAENYR